MGVVLTVLYPQPTDAARFEADYVEHEQLLGLTDEFQFFIWFGWRCHFRPRDY